MKRASIAELKSRLSEFVAIAKSGEEVLVTERGRPVARLAPLTLDDSSGARTSELIRTGAIRPPGQKLPRDFIRKAMVADSEGTLLATLLAEREEAR